MRRPPLPPGPRPPVHRRRAPAGDYGTEGAPAFRPRPPRLACRQYLQHRDLKRGQEPTRPCRKHGGRPARGTGAGSGRAACRMRRRRH